MITGSTNMKWTSGPRKEAQDKFACGGTAKNAAIEAQGDHRRTAKEELVKLGFVADTIESVNVDRKKSHHHHATNHTLIARTEQ